MWSRPDQSSLDAAAGAAERGVKLALPSNAPPGTVPEGAGQ
jgi:hypothetical protein